MRLSSPLRCNWVATLVGVTLIALAGCRKSADEFEVAARQLQYRPIEGRIYGSAYAPWPGLRDTSLYAAFAKPQLRGMSFRARVSNGSEELRARAALWDADARAATQLLGRITSRGNASAAAWSDYSAALYADAGPDDSFQFVTSLAAADSALNLNPDQPEALYNRAMALEALSLRGAAAEACRKYLRVDASSPWASEVRSRLEALDRSLTNVEKGRHALERIEQSEDELFINDTAIAFPYQARMWAEIHLGEWAERVLDKDSDGAASTLKRCRVIARVLEKHHGDSLLVDTVRAMEASTDPTRLAKAHVAYVRGRQAFAQANLAVSMTALEEARRLFKVERSPMALAAQFFLAEVNRDIGDVDRYASLLRDVSDRVPERYHGLRAQIEWSYALSAFLRGHHEDAVKLLRSASATFASVGESGRAAVTRETETILLAAAGQTTEAWRLRHASLVSAADSGDDSRLAITLKGAACEAVASGRWDVAHALLSGIVETPHPGEYLRNEALAWRVVAARRAGLSRAAAADLRAARAVEHPTEDLPLVEALLSKKPSEALTLLAESLNIAELKRNAVATSQLLVERARLFRAANEPSRAQDDLERAVALLEGNPARLAGGTLRDATLGAPSRAYCLLADSLDSRGESLRALDAIEFFKARIGTGSRSPMVTHLPMHFYSSLPARTLVITYGLFDDRLVIYASSSLGMTRTAVAANRLVVDRLVSAFDQAVAHDDLPSFQSSGRDLTRILITPIAKLAQTADTLVFVRDPALGKLPFGALTSDNKHYLIEDHAVVVTPSLSSYLRALHTRTTTSGALLSVGNSLAFGRSGSLPSLPAAESEAKEIAAMYPSKAMLIGADATKERVIGALRYCDSAHFAVHANAGLGEAMPPHLILARTADDEGKLTAAEIAALPLSGVRTVVLAGCRTAISSQGPSGTHTLVDAFIDAGVGSVVGTLWEIEDAPTREMSIMFHHELRKGSTPAEALRTTQVEMIRRGISPRLWAGLQLYGSGK